MATAETRMKDGEHRSQDARPGQPSRDSRRSTRQLDFFQAMSDFRTMFPTLDDEVIEAVLRANDGAVDATIDQLLTMTIDEDTSVVKLADFTETGMPRMLQYQDHHDTSLLATAAISSTDSPPSYSEAIKSPGTQDEVSSIWTTPISGTQSATSRSRLPLDLDLVDSDGFGALPKISPGGLKKGGSGVGCSSSTRETVSKNIGAPWLTSADTNTTRKKEFRNWNPPMLGNLPDDFLRIMSPEQSTTSGAKTLGDARTSMLASPLDLSSLTDARPKTHKSRKGDKVSRSVSLSTKDTKDKDLKWKGIDKKSKSGDKFSRSLSVTEDNAIARQREATSSSGKRSVIIETHDFSKGMLAEKMKENERRRKKTSANMDPELAQYLEDERLALALQNSEFLQELRGNEDFMKTLQKEAGDSRGRNSSVAPSLNAVPPAPVSAPVAAPVRPPEDVHQGYGDDSDRTLDAFPFSKPMETAKDDDIELQRQLQGMGKASRKQFASLAKKFFKRKKKTSRQLLNEKLAPSMMNLLEDEDDEEEDLQTDRRYQSSPPTIEPL
ncbi:hypothetical protein DPMN_015274, partial [Dreissena polymorpha]